MAFGTGLRIAFGYFDAGWVGANAWVAPLAWRPPTQAGTLRWSALPVPQTRWEER